MSFKFPVFVRAQRERDEPARQKQRSLVDIVREKSKGMPRVNQNLMPLDDARTDAEIPSASTSRRAMWTEALASPSSPIPGSFIKSLRAAQSIVVRGDPTPSPTFSCRDLSSFTHQRLERMLSKDGSLTALQQHGIPSILVGGRDVTLIGPTGCGGNATLMYCAGAAAFHAKQHRVHGGPLVIVVSPSSEEVRRCRRFLQCANLEVYLADTRQAPCALHVQCDVWLTTVFELSDWLPQALRQATEHGIDCLSEVRLIAMLEADRVANVPLVDRFPPASWQTLKGSCHPSCISAVAGYMPTRATAGAMAVHYGQTPEEPDGPSAHPADLIEIEALDATVWTDVVHTTLFAEDSTQQQAALVKELLSRERDQPKAVVVVGGKLELNDVLAILNDDPQSGLSATSNMRQFREGNDAALVVTEWALNDLTDVPPSVGLVINFGVPRNLEEQLTHRARVLFSQDARASVCEMITLVSRRRCPLPAARRLAAFLGHSKQRVPFFLSCLGEASHSKPQRR